MQENIHILNNKILLKKLKEIPQPPKVLYMRGVFGASHHKFITIVGSRKCSDYGKQIVDEICKSLVGQPITIVSGLANGIDAHAHKCALTHNLHTISVLGSGLSENILRMHTNYKLAHKILNSNSALISEYKPSMKSKPYMFPARNRIMVGLSDLVIIIEARKKSGTLITARMATDYNRDLLVIPNSIYSSHSKGSNELIKQGAYVYTEPKDIFNLLNLEYSELKINSYTPNKIEEEIIIAISNNISDIQSLIDYLSKTYNISQITQSLLNLEIEDVVKRVDGRYVVL